LQRKHGTSMHKTRSKKKKKKKRRDQKAMVALTVMHMFFYSCSCNVCRQCREKHMGGGGGRVRGELLHFWRHLQIYRHPTLSLFLSLV
jgi:hypothetical protein